MPEQRLNQVVAAERGIKTRAETALKEAYHLAQQRAKFQGHVRTYQPLTDQEDDQATETQVVQARSEALLADVAARMTELFDVAATKDFANTVARADVVLDGTLLLEKVPTSHLLFLEKKLVEIHAFVSLLPVLDPALRWSVDTGDGFYKTAPEKVARTNKKQKPVVPVPATDKHPAQMVILTEDVVVGHYTKVQHSGAMEWSKQRAILLRVERLQTAVKYARQQANMTVATPQEVGKKIFDYLLG